MQMRSALERELSNLQDEVLVLGSMVDKAIVRAVESLKTLDAEEARRIVADDTVIDQKRFQIEDRAIALIATQQPMASDLRTVVAVLAIIVELERMGDYAEGIAKIILLHGDQPLLKPLMDIPRMADKARNMLHASLDALVNRDQEAAKRIADQDDEIDALYNQVYRELLVYMIQDPRTIDRATWLLWVTHNVERIADRVTNICERVVYMVSGTMPEMNKSGSPRNPS